MSNLARLSVSYEQYLRHGWKLVPIPPASKGPVHHDWNKESNVISGANKIPDNYNVGLAHAYTGTCAIDIDDWNTAEAWLFCHGVSLKGLYDAPDAVTIESGRNGHGKLIYKMPFGLSVNSKKVYDINHKNFIDFRCATRGGLTVQDVLPPSIHPDTGKPYLWGGKGNWSNLPTIPDALLDIWLNIVKDDDVRNIRVEGSYNTSWDEINDALRHISPDIGRKEWIDVGMALHFAGSTREAIDEAFYVWDEWSSKGTKYPGQKELAIQWAPFKIVDCGIKLGTLFYYAHRAGYRRPMPDVEELFGEVKPEVPDITDGTMGKPKPSVDIKLFPRVLAKRSQEVSISIGCDVIVPLFAGLGAVCAVANAQSRLRLIDGYSVPPVLWLMTIGSPADKKTPGSKPMLEFLRQLENEDKPRYAEAVRQWEIQDAYYQAQRKVVLSKASVPEAVLSPEDMKAMSLPEPPKEPRRLQLTVSDVTSQKLVRITSDRPEGVLCYLDEMNSWIKKLLDRNSSEDRSCWTSSYEASTYKMDRVGSGVIEADNHAVSIFGNIQPMVFRQIMNGLSDDGTLQRFLFAVLRSEETRLGYPIPDEQTSIIQYSDMLRKVFMAPRMEYELSREAYEVFRKFQVKYNTFRRDEEILHTTNKLQQTIGKLEGTVGRLIFIWHLMENPFERLVSADVVERAVKFTWSYVIPAARYSLTYVASEIDDTDRLLMAYLVDKCDTHEFIILSDIRRALNIRRPDFNTAIMDSMSEFERVGWIAKVETTRDNTRWMVHPDLKNILAKYKQRIIDARNRRENV